MECYHIEPELKWFQSSPVAISLSSSYRTNFVNYERKQYENTTCNKYNSYEVNVGRLAIINSQIKTLIQP